MKLYKFINENEIQKYKGGFVVIDNRIYTNPTEETVRKAGYKPLVNRPMPEYNTESEYVETKYVVIEDSIVTVYSVKPINEEIVKE